jgi:hypothetical protein
MYPFIFLIIIAGSLLFLIPHQQLMRRLRRVEETSQALTDTLRDRCELIVEWASVRPEPDDNMKTLADLCMTARDAEPDELIKAWPKIDRLFSGAGDELFTSNNTQLSEYAQAFNDALKPYNGLLEKFPWKLYAGALMIKREKEFR